MRDDFDPHAVDVFNQNLPPAAAIADLSISSPPCDRPDVLLAGAPCQGFSTIGKRDLFDPRNELVMRATRAGLAARPKVIVMENVPAALSGAHGQIWRNAEDAMRWHGYNVRRFFASGEQSGIAQRRKRLFMICWLGSDCIRISPNVVASPSLRTALADVESVLDHDPVLLRPGSREFRIATKIPPGSKLCNVRISDSVVHTWDVPAIYGKTSAAEREVLIAIVRLRRRARRRDFGDADPVLPKTIAAHLGRSVKAELASLVDTGYLRWMRPYIDLTHTYNGKFRRLQWEAASPTVDTHFGDPALFLHPDEHRGLTPREAARIQGFPDRFTFPGSRPQRFRLVGNAVPPPMASRIAAFIRAALL